MDMRTGRWSNLGPSKLPQWSHGGEHSSDSRLVVQSGDGWWARGVGGRAPLWMGNGYGSPQWFPHEDAVLFSESHSGEYRMLRVPTDGTALAEPFYSGVRVVPQTRYAFSPTGRYLLVTDCGDGSNCILVLSVDDGTQIPIGERGRMGGVGPAWSPDETRIAYHVYDGMGGLWISALDGVPQLLVPGAPEDAPLWPAWSPDGSQLAVEMRNWLRDEPSRVCVVTLPSGDVRCIAEGQQPIWVSALPPR